MRALCAAVALAALLAATGCGNDCDVDDAEPNDTADTAEIIPGIFIDTEDRTETREGSLEPGDADTYRFAVADTGLGGPPTIIAETDADVFVIAAFVCAGNALTTVNCRVGVTDQTLGAGCKSLGDESEVAAEVFCASGANDGEAFVQLVHRRSDSSSCEGYEVEMGAE